MSFKRAAKRQNIKDKLKQAELMFRIHKPLAQAIMMLQGAYMQGYRDGETRTLAGIKAPVTPPASVLGGLTDAQRVEMPEAVAVGNSIPEEPISAEG